jgi:uncharacterized protein (DUF1501 family)
MTDLDRRHFLRLGLGAAGVAALASCMGTVPIPKPGPPPPPPQPLPPPPHGIDAAPLSQRNVVIIEMAGGHDGISMAVPYRDPAYARERRRTGVDLDRVLPVDDRVALHPNLKRLHTRGLTVVAGLGVRAPDLSHFEMLRRWWTGDPDGTLTDGTGFLGRLCDAIGDPAAPAVGLSIGYGPNPSLVSRKAVTLSIDPGGDASFPAPDDPAAADAWLAAHRRMSNASRGDTAPTVAARTGVARAVKFSEINSKLPPAGTGYPADDGLGAQLALAARIFAADTGVRVIHVPWDADFDTHENHRGRHDTIMTRLDANLDAFLSDLERRSLANRVLVASVSEFGRRVPDNGSSGLDHGAASMAVMAGPIRTGVLGDVPRLDQLDDDGNLRATVSMTEYYATIAEHWLGVPAGDVLPGSPRSLIA